MNITVFTLLLFSLQGLYWLVGKRASAKVHSQEDYFLAGKGVSFFPLMMTFLATQVGGGLILGSSDEAYRYGWPILFYPLGSGLGLIALGLYFGKQFTRFNVSTIAGILEVAYKSKLLKTIASGFSILSLFMILAAQIIASREFLAVIGLTNTPLFILFWAVVIFYTAQGGLKAVISTDIVQATFFTLLFGTLFGWALFSAPSPSFALASAIPTGFLSSKMCGWLLMPLLFAVIGQDMGQRCFAARSSKVVSMASIGAGILTIAICFVPVYMGVLAKHMGLAIPEGSSVLMKTVETISNPILTACIGCAILAAIISTASSLINAIGSNLANDFVFKKQNISFSKSLTTGLSVIAVFFSFYLKSIIDVLIQSYELSLSCLFVPILFALFKKEGNFLSALLSMIGGSIGFVLPKFISFPIPGELIGILTSLAFFGVGEAICLRQRTPKPKLEQV